MTPKIKTAINQSGHAIADNVPLNLKKINIGVWISKIEKAAKVNAFVQGIINFPILMENKQWNIFIYICYEYYYKLII